MKRWTITADKFLTREQIDLLNSYLKDQRDLSLARNNNTQAIRDYYAIKTLLESGLRVFEFCALVNSDFCGLRLSVRHGKGDKARTVLLTRSTANMLKEFLEVKAKLGHDMTPSAPLFPSRYGTAYCTRGVQKRIKLVFAAVGLPAQLSVHSLRHTNCSMLLASRKVGLATVKENLGHHSIAITNLYAHAMDDISDVELYDSPSSQKAELSEPHNVPATRKPNNPLKTFMSNVNFK